MLANKTIAFIGAGSMAEAIIAGLIAKEIVAPAQIIATNEQNEERLRSLKETYGIQVSRDKQEIMLKADIVVLAMKPKQVDEGIAAIKQYSSEKQLVISVLAGISTAYLSELLGHSAPVIRTMPNTSAKVGESATGMSAGEFATEADVALAASLFEAVGTVTVVPEEKLDAVTGVAGSGPAYIYYLVEAMEQAAQQIGLEEQEGKELIIQTLHGAVKRLSTTSKSAQQLYKEVMSPGGTTEAGLKVLSEQHFQEAIISCIKRATERSKELGEELSKVK